MVLLLILGSYKFHNDFKYWDERAPHSLAVLLCCAITRPPLSHDKSFQTKNLLPEPSQSVEGFKFTIPYWRSILSCNFSLHNYVTLQWGIAESHASFSVDHQRQFIAALSARSLRWFNALVSKNYFWFCASALYVCIQDVCAPQLRSVHPRSEPTSTSLAAFEVLYTRSDNRQGYGKSKPPRFTLWPRISLSLSLTSSPPKSAGKKISFISFSMLPIIVPILVTFLCR